MNAGTKHLAGVEVEQELPAVAPDAAGQREQLGERHASGEAGAQGLRLAGALEAVEEGAHRSTHRR